MSDPRKLNDKTRNRSRSGADQKCPHCGKQLRGVKGMKMHIKNMHADGAAKVGIR